jgi:hypothetical protein
MKKLLLCLALTGCVKVVVPPCPTPPPPAIQVSPFHCPEGTACFSTAPAWLTPGINGAGDGDVRPAPSIPWPFLLDENSKPGGGIISGTVPSECKSCILTFQTDGGK